MRNALNFQIFEEIEKLFTSNQLNTVDLILIKGYQKKDTSFFSSGIDLQELGTYIQTHSLEEVENKLIIMQKAISSIEQCDKIVIAVVTSFCFGSALEVALACDFIVSDENCKFGLFETKFGIIPDLGGTTRLVNRVGPTNAKKVIYFADKYSALEAFGMGMIDWVFPINRLQDEINKLIRMIKKNSGPAISQSKKVINFIYNNDIEKNLMREKKAQLSLIKGEDVKNRIMLYLQKLKNNN